MLKILQLNKDKFEIKKSHSEKILFPLYIFINENGLAFLR